MSRRAPGWEKIKGTFVGVGESLRGVLIEKSEMGGSDFDDECDDMVDPVLSEV